MIDASTAAQKEIRKEKALKKLADGIKCDSCTTTATTTYLTPHGDWFMCDKHNSEWQDWLNKNYPRK